MCPQLRCWFRTIKAEKPDLIKQPELVLFCFLRHLYDFYHYFYMVTNILFYVSSAINPVLYNLVSSKYRELFLSTLSSSCFHSIRERERDRLDNGINHLRQLALTVQHNPLTIQQTTLSFSITNETQT